MLAPFLPTVHVHTFPRRLRLVGVQPVMTKVVVHLALLVVGEVGQARVVAVVHEVVDVVAAAFGGAAVLPRRAAERWSALLGRVADVVTRSAAGLALI